MMHSKASVTVMMFVAVLMSFNLSQFISAQSDYRNFDSYNSKEFSVLYPPSWHIWNSTASYSQPGTEQVTIAKEMSGNVVDINNFPTKIEMTVLPSAVTGIASKDILSSWIDRSYTPQNQRKYGMYALEDIPTSLSGIAARKISYNTDYLCGGSNIVTHNIVIYAYAPSSKNTYIISFIEPATKSQFESAEVQSTIKSFEMKHFVDVDALIAKVRSGTATMDEAWEAYAAGLQRDAGIIADAQNESESEITSTPLDTNNALNQINNTPIPVNEQYMFVPYISSPPRC